MKKPKKKLEITKIIRREWKINPATRIKPSKKLYSRKNYNIFKGE